MATLSDDEEVEISVMPGCGLNLIDPIVSECCESEIAPWGCVDDVKCKLGEDADLFTDEDLTKALAWATDILNTLSGGDIGFKTRRIMPCGGYCWCRCDTCSCCVYDKLNIPDFNVCDITRVVINCTDQDLGNYRIDRDELGCPWLISLDGEWPTVQCLPLGYCDDPALAAEGCDPYSWWVEYTYGSPVTFGASLAVACLAQNYLYLCTSSLQKKCEIPKNVVRQNRQGNTIEYGANFSASRTGVRDVDFWLATVNPNGLLSSAKVRNPRNYGEWKPIKGLCCQEPPTERSFVSIQSC